VQRTPPEAKESPRVLHIDYPAAIHRLVVSSFKGRDLIWDTTESGVQGLHLAMVQNYNLILLSLREPSIDGLRIVKGLKRAGINTPVILFLPSRELEMRRSELSRYSNVLACLAKPLDIRQLDKLMEFLRDPPDLRPKDKAKLLEVLARIETAVSAEA
jgi:CheY-like chemotaxis protein